VFKLTPDGSETVLHSFRHDGSDGILPTGGLIMDKHGNLYGTSYSGGHYDSGTVFKISPHGRETVLHGFAGNDGNHPAAGLISDTDGNLYGTTAYGGTYSGCDIGCGTVFKLAPDGTETVLHSFNGSDGAGPEAELLVDKQGNFYGTTTYGGIGSCYMECGIIFKLAPDLTETVLHSFPAKRRDGENPLGGLIENHKGDLFGTTYDGGPYYGGVVFKLEPDGSEHILQPLSRGSGINPVGRLLMDRLGNLYGTAQQGGAGGAGTIFKIQKN
jgi:uncharacterized repeat protein (TIGR03803 family)